MNSPDTNNSDFAIDPHRLEQNWRAITVELDAPRASRFERLLRRLGLPSSVTRVMVATPALRRSWFVAMGVALTISLLAVSGDAQPDDLLTMLILAPLLPVVGVALAYGSSADPSHEITLSTPMSGLRLICLRAVVVLLFSTAASLFASLIVASVSPMAFAWLVPSVGLTGIAVALMTATTPRRAAAIVSFGWLITVLIIRGAAESTLAPFALPVQISIGVLGGAAIGFAYLRREQFDLIEVGR